MTELCLLFQGWGEERVIGEQGVAWLYHTKSMHNNNQVRLGELPSTQPTPEAPSDSKVHLHRSILSVIVIFMLLHLHSLYLSFNKPVGESTPTLSESQLQDTFSRVPEDLLVLWREQRDQVTHLKLQSADGHEEVLSSNTTDTGATITAVVRTFQRPAVEFDRLGCFRVSSCSR